VVEPDTQPEIQPDSQPQEEVLTIRQRTVLERIAQGLTNKEIAEYMHISENTVKYHVRQILERLQKKNRHELAHYVHTQQTAKN
jgi:DNA-binding NarL/FixJ family response regulator